MEQVVAFEIACVLREKFGGDSLEEVQAQLRATTAWLGRSLV